MYELAVQSNSENYKVAIGVDVSKLLNNFDAVVSDQFFANKFASEVPIHWLVAKESNKNLSGVEAICSFFQEHGLTRNSRVLAIGGGIVQDLVTLAASIYMRGIKWSYAPTTLTGMMDSCLGGKSSINVGNVKNLIGNIYPPEQIFIDTTFVNTLDKQSVTSGLAEGVKITFAKGSDEFTSFISNPASIDPVDSQDLIELIMLTLSSKRWFIEIDEYDKAERQLLNFGHSFGHAYEAACGFSIQHGLGVAIGMLAAIRHPDSSLSEESKLLYSYCSDLASSHVEEISHSYEATDWQIFRNSLRSDKKNTSDSLTLILPGSTSPLDKFSFPFSTGSIDQASQSIQEAINSILEKTTND